MGKTDTTKRKKITEFITTFEIFDGSPLDKVLESLLEIKEKYSKNYSGLFLNLEEDEEFLTDEYGSSPIFKLMGNRFETDKEYNKRLECRRKQLEKNARIRKEKEAKSLEERKKREEMITKMEYETYLALKKKYENSEIVEKEKK